MKNILTLLFMVIIVFGAIITTNKLYIVSNYVAYIILGIVFVNFIAYNAVNIDKDDESDHVYSRLFMSLLRHLLCVVVINGIILLLLSIE